MRRAAQRPQSSAPCRWRVRVGVQACPSSAPSSGTSAAAICLSGALVKHSSQVPSPCSPRTPPKTRRPRTMLIQVAGLCLGVKSRAELVVGKLVEDLIGLRRLVQDAGLDVSGKEVHVALQPSQRSGAPGAGRVPGRGRPAGSVRVAGVARPSSHGECPVTTLRAGPMAGNVFSARANSAFTASCPSNVKQLVVEAQNLGFSFIPRRCSVCPEHEVVGIAIASTPHLRQQSRATFDAEQIFRWRAPEVTSCPARAALVADAGNVVARSIRNRPRLIRPRASHSGRRSARFS